MSSERNVPLDSLPMEAFPEEEATVADVRALHWAEFHSQAGEPAARRESPTSEELHSPFLTRAAAIHAKRYGNLVDERNRGRVMIFGQLALIAILVVAYVINYRTPRVVPYVVQQDEHGYVVAIQPAGRGSAEEENVVIYEVANFFRSMRTVIGDRRGQAALVEATYAHVPSGAASRAALDRWYQENNPMADDAIQTVVDITRVQPLESSNTLTVEWTETKIEHGIEAQTKFTALVSIEVHPVMTQEELIANPLGIFVNEYSVERLD